MNSSRKFYVWDGVDRAKSPEDLRKKYQDLRAKGIEGVFLGGGISEPDFDAVREAGLELHSWMWGTNRGDAWIRENHPEWYMVSRTGKSCYDKPPYVDYYRWVAPVIPGVQTYLEERVAELAAHPSIQGVHLDYIRYPDVILPRGLWEQYGLDQTTELPEYDFSYDDATRAAFKEVSGRDPLYIERPDLDQEWLHFRFNSVTNLVKKLKVVSASYQKSLTAAVFPTPRLARKICRQDWDKWPLDAACPMIYHSFYNEEVSWVGEMVRENIQTVTFPVIAGLYMPAFSTPEEFKEGLALSFDNGAAGISLFGGVAEEYWTALGEFRSQRGFLVASAS